MTRQVPDIDQFDATMLRRQILSLCVFNQDINCNNAFSLYLWFLLFYEYISKSLALDLLCAMYSDIFYIDIIATFKHYNKAASTFPKLCSHFQSGFPIILFHIDFLVNQDIGKCDY